MSTALVKRDVIMQLGGFDASLRYSEDRFMWTRIAEHWEIHTVPQVLLERTVNSGNMTAQPKKYYPNKIRFIEVYLARYGAQLSKQQRIDFVLGNHTDFLNAFSRRGEHARGDRACTGGCSEYSWQALIFANGKPTLRYLYACAQDVAQGNGVNHRSLNRYPPWPITVW